MTTLRLRDKQEWLGRLRHPRLAPRGSRLVALTAMIALSQTVGAEPADSLKAVVMVEQSVTVAEPWGLDATIQTAPSAIVTNKAGTTPSQLIEKLYGVRRNAAPDAYDILEARVLELNGAPDAKSLPSGRVVVPDLPRLSSATSAVRQAEIPTVARYSTGSEALPVAIDTARGPLYDKPVRLQLPPDTARINRVDVYNSDVGQQIYATARNNGQAARIGMEMNIALASSTTDCSMPIAPILTNETHQLISQRLAGYTGAKERYLVILDTGWPNAIERTSALTTLRGIYDRVRTAMKIKEEDVPRFSIAAPSNSFSGPTHAHACLIHRALQEMRALDLQQRIKVVFLPLKPGQDGATALFEETLMLDQLIRNGGATVFTERPNPNGLRAASTFVKESLRTLPALSQAWNPNDDVVRIYEPLISGLIRILDAYARIDGNVDPEFTEVDARFWISVSWSFNQYAAAPDLPMSSKYVVFAAAGNDKTDFVLAQRLFASEALNNNRVVAVMNTDEHSQALTCNSATFPGIWDEENAGRPIVSFPGRLGNAAGDACPGTGGGTSFSTPRVAWLVAAAELPQQVDESKWLPHIAHQLAASRKKSATDPLAAPLDITTLFGQK